MIFLQVSIIIVFKLDVIEKNCHVELFLNYFLTEETRKTLDPLLSFAEYSKPVANGILELTSKLKESSIVPAIPFPKINPTNIIQSVG